MTIAIALGVAIPVLAALAALLFLHRRNVQKQRREDSMDPHKSLDFGLGDHPAVPKTKRKSFLGREKDAASRYDRQQMSMDMNLSSPYLLPPGLQNSRESLARTLTQTEDPYRPITNITGSDTGSVRSLPRGSDARSNSRQDAQFPRPPNSSGFSVPPRQNSLPKSGLASPEPTHAKPGVLHPEDLEHVPAPLRKDGSVSMPDSPEWEDDYPVGTAVQEPPAVATKMSGNPTISPVQPSPADSGVVMGYEIENPFEKEDSQESLVSLRQTAAGLGLVGHVEPMQSSLRSSSSSTDSLPTIAPPQRGQTAPPAAPIIEEPLEYYDYDFVDEPQNVAQDPRALQGTEGRGRTMQRQSRMAGDEHGLGVPHQDSRRLSVGFRPLPPDEIMESEDPEYRANRIRSFYKEYFEDGRPAEGAPPMPPMPAQHQNNGRPRNNTQPHNKDQRQIAPHQQNGQYYEDYSEGYMPDAPYFDPETNSFVMPYAQPVSRRAMTPPPTGQRFPGPRPPRAFHGSMGGMHMPPGPYGPPRPGSSVSNRMGPPRPGSGASGMQGRPRAGSAMSGSRHGGPRKPLPPPSALNTLPTPSKLKDDSFALLNSIEFAPPETFAERVRGRSQSPAGERRPYKLGVPVHSPLVNAFEELPTLPSPHLLRKSTTFTALDFAPPRKFGDSDTRSETGSIRSNRSGISAQQLGAIRNGAGRVSRLPEDAVFTQAAMQDKLKPSWAMRD
ncbi:hypothetical protein B0H67DRAFT_497806 [Lasiosphaeris hirsuta]|uniref:Uncharacterized protein n=1 Tax=Lasiosphaeris hirsuta TaxID=260670 RepID=A0AA40DMF9_9PEZI|nr:hypothetical protein B0H67DRAFT_497806 [Lasiosphaeris hirsuta]